MIQLKDIHKSFPSADGSTPIVRGVSLEVPTHSFCALTGPSGSGKSTILNIIAGLEAVERGDALINSTSITALDRESAANFRLHNIGIVFQFFNFLPTLNIQQNVGLPGMLLGTSRKEISHRCEELLEDVGIYELRSKLPNQVSGGELQRAAIARALFNRPAIILADEPTGNLDRHNGEAVLGIFRKIVNERKATVLMVTHDRHFINCVDKAFSIEDGHLLP